VVKGLYYDAKICHDAPSAITAFNSISGAWGIPIIVQKLVKGEAAAVRNMKVHVLRAGMKFRFDE